jgi:hypothetical protein
MFREAKLVELRRKTDRELVFLLRKELARGLRLAEAAGTKESELYVQAERAYLMSTRGSYWSQTWGETNGGNWNSASKNLSQLWNGLPSRRIQLDAAAASAD